MVTFPGSARDAGIGLDKTPARMGTTELRVHDPQGTSGCAFLAPLGSTELVETSLSASGLPIVVKGISVPPAPTGRICIES